MPYTRISFEHRIIIVTLKEEGISLRKIRNIMLVRHGVDVTIEGIRKIFLEFKNTGKYEDQKRSWRPHKLNLRSKRCIRRICLKNRRLSLSNIAGTFNMMSEGRISTYAVNRILLKYGLRSHRPVNKPFLTDRQRKNGMGQKTKIVDNRRLVPSCFQRRMHISHT